MAFSRIETSKLFARDIAAYGDAEPDQYLEANGRHAQVEDWDFIMKDEAFIQRLKARAGASDTAPSHPIDLNDISARYEEVPADKEPSPQRQPYISCLQLVDGEHKLVPAYRDPLPQRYSSVSSTASPLDEKVEYRRDLEEEAEYYNKLINAGGRPSHPASLGRDVLQNPGQYREILSYWQLVNHDAEGRKWKVFESQLRRWEKFLESHRRKRTDGPLEETSDFWSLPAKPGRFAEHCQWLHDRLARHGFKRSFQLNEDPDRQDKLTTWIEYLGYQYVQYDKHADIMECLQQQYDEAWKKLVDSNVLEPFETEEYIWTFKIGLQMKDEEIEAKKAVESATSTVKLAEKVLLQAQSVTQSKPSLSQMEQRLSTARSELAAATKSLERASRRNFIGDFYDQTKEYSIAKKKADHESKLLQWILQQVPLIELELNLPKEIDTSTEGDGRQRRSLKRNRADDRDEEPVSKRRRRDDEDHTLSESKTPASTEQQPMQTRSSHSNPSIPPSIQRALRASRPSTTKSGSAKSDVVLTLTSPPSYIYGDNSWSGEDSDHQIF